MSTAQLRALDHVALRAAEGRARARDDLTAALRETRGPGDPPTRLDGLLLRLREHAVVTLNFHPDRLLAHGSTVADSLLREGRYLSQFETQITNGSPTAFAGGDRDRWEERLFGAAYHQPGVGRGERPKYGALNLLAHADGGSPRFGSCYFELAQHMTERCTFTWGDSHDGPEHVGTSAALEAVLAASLEVDARWLQSLPRLDRHAGRGPVRTAIGRALDVYIEAQVHADIDLASDVETLVIDPSFEGTETGDRLRELCTRYGIGLHHHAGFVLATKDVPSDFRGPRMVPLAELVARSFASVGGQVDAFVLGRAAQSLVREPSCWQAWGTFEETLQHIKQLWHVLVQYGSPRSEET